MYSDEQLVIRWQQGVSEASEQLIDRYYCRVLNYIRLQCPNYYEDITQEVFVKATINITTLMNPSSFRPWLFRIARNKIIDVRRQETNLHSIPLNYVAPKKNIKNNKELEACIQKLSEEERNVLSLCVIFEESYRTVAKLCKKSKSWVGKKQKQIINKVRECIQARRKKQNECL